MFRFRIFIKLLKESVLFALHALRANKLRTFLSLLGITIGIFSIISVFTVVDGMENNIHKSMESLGENVIFIEKWPWEGGFDSWWKYWQRPLPAPKELEELKKRTTTIEAFSFEAYIGNKTIKYLNNSVENATIGVASNDYDKIKSFDLREGRYFSETEFATGRALVIIGADIADGLFGNTSAIGKSIKIMGHRYEVIGVFKKEGKDLLDTTSDNLLLIMLNNARNIIDLRKDNVNPFIKAKVKPGIAMKYASDDLKSAMRSIRKLRPRQDDNFALNESTLISSGISSLFGTVNFAGGFIAIFSIIVGGFGIANIMFVSVKERTNQIGIQKSLGAKRYFILLQFLIEAITLCLIGGMAGLFIIYILTLFAEDAMGFALTLTVENLIWGLGISAFIGVLSGFIPAWSASRLDPVEAIRSNG